MVVGFEKEQWGGQFGMSVGLAARRLMLEEFPRYEFFHVRMPLKFILADDEKHLLNALDLENTAVNGDQREEYVKMLVEKGVEWLEQFTTEQALADRIRNDESFSRRTYLVLKRHLGIECD